MMLWTAPPRARESHSGWSEMEKSPLVFCVAANDAIGTLQTIAAPQQFVCYWTNRWGNRPAGVLFTSARGAPFSTAGFARMVERVGRKAKLAFKAHPHMLRHACGYALANKGHDTRALQAYLGHRNIQHTVRYTELSPTRFKDFWRK